MRTTGEILEDLSKIAEKDDYIRMLIKELVNACGSDAQALKEHILSCAMAESEEIPEKGDKNYISIDALEQIILTIG